MILYCTKLSSYSIKVRLAASWKGIALELCDPPGGSYRSAAYAAIVKMRTVPALVDGDFVLSESDAILEYLEDRFPEPPLRPADLQRRAWMRFLGRFHDLHLEPPVRALFSELPPSTRNRDAVQARAAQIADKLVQVEEFLDPHGPFAVGARPSLADCAYPATLAIVERIAPALGFAAAFGPRLVRMRAAIAAEKGFAAVLEPYQRDVDAWIASRTR